MENAVHLRMSLNKYGSDQTENSVSFTYSNVSPIYMIIVTALIN